MQRWSGFSLSPVRQAYYMPYSCQHRVKTCYHLLFLDRFFTFRAGWFMYGLVDMTKALTTQSPVHHPVQYRQLHGSLRYPWPFGGSWHYYLPTLSTNTRLFAEGKGFCWWLHFRSSFPAGTPCRGMAFMNYNYQSLYQVPTHTSWSCCCPAKLWYWLQERHWGVSPSPHP